MLIEWLSPERHLEPREDALLHEVVDVMVDVHVDVVHAFHVPMFQTKQRGVAMSIALS